MPNSGCRFCCHLSAHILGIQSCRRMQMMSRHGGANRILRYELLEFTNDYMSTKNQVGFFHVVVGIILISIILGIVSIVSLPPASPNQATLHRLCDAGRRGSETKRTFRCSPLGGNQATRQTQSSIGSICWLTRSFIQTKRAS